MWALSLVKLLSVSLLHPLALWKTAIWIFSMRFGRKFKAEIMFTRVPKFPFTPLMHGPICSM
jgi:hypothetical protein